MKASDLQAILALEVGSALAYRLMIRIGRELGGERVYIPRRSPSLSATPDRRLTVKEIQHCLGVSRSTAYRRAREWRAKVSNSPEFETGQ